jgi:hypothetical protein
VGTAPALVGAAATEEQARLDAAMDAFEARMTEAGWTSQGDDDDLLGDDELDDELEDDLDDVDVDEAAEDDAFAACVGELGAVFEDFDDDDEFPGELARSESAEMIYAPEGAPATTEAFSFDLTEQTVAAFAVTVDDASAPVVTELLEVFGSKETSECLKQGFEEDLLEDAEDSDIPAEFEFEVTNEGDLGIGEHSAAISYQLSMVFMVPITVNVDMVLAQVGNDMVAVFHVISGEQQTEFDPRTELQAILDSLA